MKVRAKRVSPFISILLGIILVSLSACGGGSDAPDERLSGTGSIVFSVVWKGGSTGSSNFQPAKVDCNGLGVVYIEAIVYVSDPDSPEASGGPWECDQPTGEHSYTISEIRPGTYTVMAVGMDDDGDVVVKGDVSGIVVEAGKTTNAGEVQVDFMTLLWDQGKWDLANWGP